MTPRIAANNFELKTSLISLVQQNTFTGSPLEDANQHLANFLEICDTVKANGVEADAIRLMAFPFSLTGKAKVWLRSHPKNTIRSWGQMAKLFLAKFFPPSKTLQIRNQIMSFTQQDDESLYECWERFKELLHSCPHHKIEKWFYVQLFYNGLNASTRATLDAAAGGALMNLEADAAYDLIDRMSINHYQWTAPRSTQGASQRSQQGAPGKLELDPMKFLAARLDQMSKKLDSLSVNAVETVPPCAGCGSTDHATMECKAVLAQLEEPEPEQVNALDKYGRPINDPYSNTYNPGTRNHPNFRWRNDQQPHQPGSYNHSQGAGAPRGASYQYPQQQAPPPQKSNLEEALANFVNFQTKFNEKIDENLTNLNKKVDQLATQSKMLETQSKMLETQVAQQAAATSSRAPGTFPGKPEINPIGECKTISVQGGDLVVNTSEDQDQNQTEGAPGSNTGASQGAPSDSAPDAEPALNSKKHVQPQPYKQNLPYPQRFARTKIDSLHEKFLEMLKKIHIDIPFTDVLLYMPAYAKFLKEVLTNKKALMERETVALTEHCSAVMSNKMPQKQKDQGRFTVPCQIGNTGLMEALCDVGASVSLMPYSIYQKCDMGDLKPTRMTLQLADRSTISPKGVLEDVPLQVGKFYIPVDFVVVEMEVDEKVPLILGRPFLSTAGVLIDCKNGRLSMNVNGESEEYSIGKPMKQLIQDYACYDVDRFAKMLSKNLGEYIAGDPLQFVLENSESPRNWHKVKDLLVLLHSSPGVHPKSAPESLKSNAPAPEKCSAAEGAPAATDAPALEGFDHDYLLEFLTLDPGGKNDSTSFASPK